MHRFIVIFIFICLKINPSKTIDSVCPKVVKSSICYMVISCVILVMVSRAKQNNFLVGYGYLKEKRCSLQRLKHT